MRIDVITLFPELFEPFVRTSFMGRATTQGAARFRFKSPRDHGLGRHRSVDDTPYGGGSGMVMRVDVLVATLEALDLPGEATSGAREAEKEGEPEKRRGSDEPAELPTEPPTDPPTDPRTELPTDPRTELPTDPRTELPTEPPTELRSNARDVSVPPRGHRVLLTPQGTPFTQSHAKRFATLEALTLVCGRYEGFDERVRLHVDEEVSLGDFVMTGGEVAAMAVIEATVRLLPGVLGNASSVEEESHGDDGLLEYAQYTRPQAFRGVAVPEVLSGGNHMKIKEFRDAERLTRTRERRPDLWAKHEAKRSAEQAVAPRGKR